MGYFRKKSFSFSALPLSNGANYTSKALFVLEIIAFKGCIKIIQILLVSRARQIGTKYASYELNLMF